MNPFTYFTRPSASWFHAGPASSFPDIDPAVDSADLSQPRQIPASCGDGGSGPSRIPGCIITLAFHNVVPVTRAVQLHFRGA